MPDHTDGTDGKASPLQHQMQRPWSKVGQVTRQIKSVPSGTKPVEGKAVDVRDGDKEFAARHQQPMRFLEDFQRSVNVLQRVPHGDDIETGRAEFRVRQSTDEPPQAQFRTNALDGGH